MSDTMRWAGGVACLVFTAVLVVAMPGDLWWSPMALTSLAFLPR